MSKANWPLRFLSSWILGVRKSSVFDCRIQAPRARVRRTRTREQALPVLPILALQGQSRDPGQVRSGPRFARLDPLGIRPRGEPIKICPFFSFRKFLIPNRLKLTSR